MNPPVPPPPQVDAAGVWSESAYAQFIFGGGKCIVKKCRRWTDRFPCSYALRMRVCSEKCETLLYRNYDKTERKIENVYLTSCAIPGKRGLRKIGQAQRMHFRDWLPYDERDMTKYPMYGVSAIGTADNEWFSARNITEKRPERPPVAVLRTRDKLQMEYKLRAEALPRIMNNAMALQKWSDEYAASRKSVDQINLAFIKKVVSTREQIPYRALMRTRIVHDAMESLGRSLSKFDIRSWCGIRAVAIRQYHALPRGRR
ncbi:Dienelactone hydrolase endo-1,3,1,4-beta-D-glucanase [Mycena sanguinolenta]|uniref:Dienelactone hydrolase endo-1,3,1,4-beta-D-glucanase n=1 Tax=Mycena sanguinolenta TaxID=230812 RepID=A0A8H6XGZ5_9AGAR|nr:Dienelactone hydrolase endo-1,3,1,4-beta-D-glucanase [Mycena sanguinolenta]